MSKKKKKKSHAKIYPAIENYCMIAPTADDAVSGRDKDTVSTGKS